MGELQKVMQMANRPLNELLSRDMVDIYVGPDSIQWVLHEKLLCAKSTFFRRTFYNTTSRPSSSSSNASDTSNTSSPAKKSLGLPEDDPAAFTAFVSWLYASSIPAAFKEDDLTVVYELALMSERWGIPTLRDSTLSLIRHWYRSNDTFPGLRRVQYVMANTSKGAPLREFLLSCVARAMVLGEGELPAHWEKALRRDGGLAVEVLEVVRKWGLKGKEVPDVRQEDEESPEKEDNENIDEEADEEDGEEVDEEADEEVDNEVDEEQAPEKGEEGEERQEGEKKQEGEEKQEGKDVKLDGETFNQKTLEKELPNGLVNGVH